MTIFNKILNAISNYSIDLNDENIGSIKSILFKDPHDQYERFTAKGILISDIHINKIFTDEIIVPSKQINFFTVKSKILFYVYKIRKDVILESFDGRYSSGSIISIPYWNLKCKIQGTK